MVNFVHKSMKLIAPFLLLRALPAPSVEIPASVSADSIRKHVQFLGDDALEGRATDTRGEALAAQYIAVRLAEWGLTPMGENRTFFQTIPLHGSKPLRQSQLVIHADDGEHRLELGRDYLLFKSGAQTFIPQPTPMVFVGYGIAAPEFDYNDYQTIDAEGKIVVFLAGEPPSADPLFFNGEDPTIYSQFESKQRLAVSRGALGCILLPTPDDLTYGDWEKKKDEFSFEDVTLAYTVTGNLSAAVNSRIAAHLFEGAPYSLEQVYEMNRRGLMRSFSLNRSLSFHGVFAERDFIGYNVIGMIEGRLRKSKGAYVLISAHYDHLGIGPPVAGDSIYNGVLDNALGVAGALELARLFALSSPKPLHSLIFLFTTGEEKGLLGSTYYCDHPLVPLHQTIANLNIDGLAADDTFNDIVGLGAEWSTLDVHLEKTASLLGLQVSPVPSPFLASESFARSDQWAFARAGIPSILISNGLNYRHWSLEQALQKTLYWYRNIYHSPVDDLSQPINYEAARQHVQVLAVFCRSAANSKTLPQWKAGAPFMAERLRTIAEKR